MLRSQIFGFDEFDGALTLAMFIGNDVEFEGQCPVVSTELLDSRALLVAAIVIVVAGVVVVVTPPPPSK